MDISLVGLHVLRSCKRNWAAIMSTPQRFIFDGTFLIDVAFEVPFIPISCEDVIAVGTMQKYVGNFLRGGTCRVLRTILRRRLRWDRRERVEI
jgi:hypothetical protein